MCWVYFTHYLPASCNNDRVLMKFMFSAPWPCWPAWPLLAQLPRDSWLQSQSRGVTYQARGAVTESGNITSVTWHLWRVTQPSHHTTGLASTLYHSWWPSSHHDWLIKCSYLSVSPYKPLPGLRWPHASVGCLHWPWPVSRPHPRSTDSAYFKPRSWSHEISQIQWELSPGN